MNLIPSKTPSLIKLMFPGFIWDLKPKDQTEKVLYLTFDDGPIPEVTDFVLSELQKYKAKATFFCIGNNVKKNPEILNKILDQGHSVGNHTYHHDKAWKTSKEEYLESIEKCEVEIRKVNQLFQNRLFRPPYGQISKTRFKSLKQKGYRIVMWDVLSRDWEQQPSKEKCYHNVVNNTQSGSIIIFHDSIKAWSNLQYTLPKVLNYYTKKGYIFEKIV